MMDRFIKHNKYLNKCMNKYTKESVNCSFTNKLIYSINIELIFIYQNRHIYKTNEIFTSNKIIDEDISYLLLMDPIYNAVNKAYIKSIYKIGKFN